MERQATCRSHPYLVSEDYGEIRPGPSGVVVCVWTLGDVATTTAAFDSPCGSGIVQAECRREVLAIAS